ncbi:MAG TPA: hypothetical protein VKM37_00245 [Balneolaceae bacterium]|nr:hypothetical protein [Balneolaceae bacterium]
MDAYSGEVGHPFRTIPAACSGRSRPSVPIDSGHSFRMMSATFSEQSDAVFYFTNYPV